MDKKWKIVLAALSIIIAIAILVFVQFYAKAYKGNVKDFGNQRVYLYLKERSTIEDVFSQLSDIGALNDLESFKWMAEFMEYDHRIIPGKYRIIKGESNYHFIKRLRGGSQDGVNVTFINQRTISDLAHQVCSKIDVDSVEFVTLLRNEAFLDSLGFKPQNIISMFIPNTYQFMWATNARKFIVRMKREYKTFWNESRLAKASRIGLSPDEVATLASIVDEETNKIDEKPIVAGLYINRIKRGIPLQADPTIKFALGDFGRKRILTVDLGVNSLYNTYKNLGLPPGPIRMPSVEGIDAVLNYSEHKFIFMCAKEDLSGYHNFATSLHQHNINAQKYQRAIHQMGIKR